MKAASNKLDGKKVGLTLGILFALMHLAWIFIVNLGWGQAATRLLYYLHFLDLSPTIETFSFIVAISGVITAFIFGYLIGWVFSALWNWVNKEKKIKKKR